MDAYRIQGAERGHVVEVLDVADLRRLSEFDACYLRLDTNVLGLSWAASRYAWELGLRVVDDPGSILTCMNKAHVQGLLEAAGVPTPQTVLLTRAGYDALDPEAMFQELGAPIVVKAPSGAFSSAVEKADDARDLKGLVRRFSGRSDVVLLQRYTPSTYDWRVGILCGEPLYAARYHIPQGAWRIHDRPEGGTRREWAKVERVHLDDVPWKVMDAAFRAGRAVGNGLYGVDVKQVEGGAVVIEVNDNPNIDFGEEVPADSDLWGGIIDRIATEGPRA